MCVCVLFFVRSFDSRQSIVQVFGAEENDNAIFFSFGRKLYQRPRNVDYDIHMYMHINNKRFLSNAKKKRFASKCANLPMTQNYNTTFYVLADNVNPRLSWAQQRQWKKKFHRIKKKWKKFIKYECKLSVAYTQSNNSDMNQYA